MVGDKPPRTVIETPEFIAQRDELIDVRMFDEVMNGVVWALAHDPEDFTAVGAGSTRVLITTPFPGIPRFRIFFTHDDANVWLHWIETADGAAY